jgi:hypothetical protein
MFTSRGVTPVSPGFCSCTVVLSHTDFMDVGNEVDEVLGESLLLDTPVDWLVDTGGDICTDVDARSDVVRCELIWLESG